MTSEEKKAYLLLKTIIFQYHGLDEDEQQLLEETASEIDGSKELSWVNDFVSQDYYDAFDRARKYLKTAMNALDKAKRLHFLFNVWEANNQKGYISEMEATAMIKLAQDWGVDKELMENIKK